MAYVVRETSGNFEESTTSVSINIPTHEEDDVLLLFVGADNRTLSGIPGTWTQEAYLNSGEDIYCYSHVGQSTPETTFTATASGTTGRYTYHFAVCKDVPTTSYIDTFSTAATASNNAPRTPAISPTSAGCLVFSFIAQGGNFAAIPAPGMYYLSNQKYSSNIATSLGYFPHAPASTTTGTIAFTQGIANNDVAAGLTIALKTSGDTEAYSDPSNPPATMFYPFGIGGDGGEYGTSAPETDFSSTGNNVIPSVSGGANTTTYNVGGSTEGNFINGYSSYRCFTASSGAVDKYLQRGFELSAQQDLSGKIISFVANAPQKAGNPAYDDYHAYMGFSDGTNAAIWKVNGQDTSPSIANATPTLIEIDAGLEDEEFGTFNSADIDYIVMGGYAAATQLGFVVSPMYVLDTMTILGGGSTNRPASFSTCAALAGNGVLNTVQGQVGQARAQFYATQNISIGNGSDTINWDSTGQSLEYPVVQDLSTLSVQSKISVGAFTFTIDGNCNLSSNTFNMGSFHNFVYSSGTVTGAGLVLNGDVDLQAGALTGWTFASCKEITNSGCDLSGGNTITTCTESQVVTITSEAEFNRWQNCTFDTNSALVFLITGNQTGTWSGTGMTVSGGAGSYDIQYTGTTDFTIQFDTGSGWSSGRTNETGGGNLTISAPTTDVTINSNIASSDIKIFDGASTQTVTASATDTTLAYTYSGTKTWYYTVQKAGYVPQRGSITGTDVNLEVNVTLAVDPVYTASHGLTFTTDYSYNATTRVLTIVAAEEGRNIYSSLIEEFISRSALYNRPFPLTVVGPDRIDFMSDGTTASTIDAGDVQFWRGAGMEWEHATTGAKTHKYCSLKGVGANAASTKGYYQYAAGSGTTALSLVSNNVDQVIQYYSDPNGDGSVADGYDRSAHLVIKLFNTGYYQKRADVLTAFGISALESFEYTLDLQMSAFDFASGDQGITITTLTDDSAAPQDHASSGNAFSYELVDPGTNTGAALAAQLNYDIYTDPTATVYTSYTAFNLPDIIIGSSGVYETQEGWVENEDDTLGFYVSRSAADHPDFLRFEDDDGTYYTPAVLANITITGLTDTGTLTRMQIANQTAEGASDWAASTAYSVGDVVLRTSGVGAELTAGLYMRCTTAGTSNDTEPTWDTTVGNTTADTAGSGAGNVVWTTYGILFYDDDPASTGYSDTYIDGKEFLAGETCRIRFTDLNGSTSFYSYETTTIASTSGISVAATPEADDVYAANGLDGSAFDGTYSPNYVSNYLALDTNTDFAGTSAFAYFLFTLTSSAGMYKFWGGVTALDVGNYRIESDVLDLYFDETAGFVKQTDDVRIFRKDGARPALDPTTGTNGIEINWKTPVSVVTSGSGLSAGQAIELTKAADATVAVDGTVTLSAAIRDILAATAGERTGASGDTLSMWNRAKDTAVMAHETDADGNTVSMTRG